MQGFFTRKETESKSRPDGKVYSCIGCGRYKDCNSPKLEPLGGFEKGILNIGVVPSDMEDIRSKGYISREWSFIKKSYSKIGIDFEKDCLNTYAVRCYDDKEPSSFQIDCCRKFLIKTINKYKPKIIVFFGDVGLYSVIGHKWKKELGTISKWVGYTVPDQEYQSWVVPIYDPYFVMNGKTEVTQVLWEQVFDKLKSLINSQTPFPVYKEPEIIYLEDDLTPLNGIKSNEVAFDYETTGLKPQAEGHRIISASVAVNENKVYTFLMPETRKKRKPFTDILINPNIRKIAQNMKFEDTWSVEKLKVKVVNWFYDTMQASHIIDNKPGITGLKFQTYVQFGVIDYSSDVEPFLRSKTSKDGNAFNSILELLKKPNGKHMLLKYNALDSIFEYRLANLTKKAMLGTQGQSNISPIISDFPNAYKLMHQGVLEFAKAERQGFRIDTNYAERAKKRLTRKIEILEKEIYSSKFYKHWQHTTKAKINLNSDKMLANYLYGVKKIKPLVFTKSGKGSTNEEALKLLDIPELNWIIERSKLLKLRDTYLEAFIREQVDGYIHPFYNLHFVQTYRSSSDRPNFQNIPKKDKESMKIVRSAIYPRPGYQFLEMDFSGIEVAIAACYHQDKNMIKYIKDKSTDMHSDMSKQIFILNKFDKSKPDYNTLRQAAKNTFVFPQFYGDYYKNNAIGMCSTWLKLPQTKWDKSMGIEFENSTIAAHLISKGIKSFDDFVNHIKTIEKDFWGKRFAGYAKWKDTYYQHYLENGYISLKTGFVCKGLMGKNDVINYPVQGAAFHCLLWTFIQVSKKFEELGLQSKLVGQIHDALIVDTHPSELNQVHEIVQYFGTQKILEAFPWIIVPLAIDAELCDIDASWASKKKWEPTNNLPF